MTRSVLRASHRSGRSLRLEDPETNWQARAVEAEGERDAWRETAMGHRDDANQFDRERAAAEAALSASQARAEKLTQALRPFAINAGAVSLSGALGHITREDLIRAREALSVTGGGE